MPTDRLRMIESLHHAALERDPASREAFLNQATDPRLNRNVAI